MRNSRPTRQTDSEGGGGGGRGCGRCRLPPLLLFLLPPSRPILPLGDVRCERAKSALVALVVLNVLVVVLARQNDKVKGRPRRRRFGSRSPPRSSSCGGLRPSDAKRSSNSSRRRHRRRRQLCSSRNSPLRSRPISTRASPSPLWRVVGPTFKETASVVDRGSGERGRKGAQVSLSSAAFAAGGEGPTFPPSFSSLLTRCRCCFSIKIQIFPSFVGARALGRTKLHRFCFSLR